jgi:hypothetical protein
MATMPFDNAIPYRVGELERERARNDAVVDAHATRLTVLEERDAMAAKSIDELKSSVVYMTRALIGLCITIAGSAAAISHFTA